MVFVSFYPIIFAPYFAHLTNQFGMWSGLYVSIISSVMLLSLAKIHDDLEDPFDEVGRDDINLEMLTEVHHHMF